MSRTADATITVPAEPPVGGVAARWRGPAATPRRPSSAPIERLDGVFGAA